MSRSRFKPISMSFACLAICSACALASEETPHTETPGNFAAYRQYEPARGELDPMTRIRRDRLSACFLSHLLQERIELACDEDLFFAPLHQSFYAKRMDSGDDLPILL